MEEELLADADEYLAEPAMAAGSAKASAGETLAPPPPPAEKSRTEQRLRAQPDESTPDSQGTWRDMTDPDTVQQIDQALQMARQKAQGGSYSAAVTTLERWIRPPARAGLFVAYQAAVYASQADNVPLALDVIDRGLRLGAQESPEYRQLTAYRSQLQRQLKKAGKKSP
jgi:dsRNA-specific ribonuclease